MHNSLPDSQHNQPCSRFKAEALMESDNNLLRRQKPENSIKSVWDCESKLYDSFELMSFSDHLYRTLNPWHHHSHLRSFSMPHLASADGNKRKFVNRSEEMKRVSVSDIGRYNLQSMAEITKRKRCGRFPWSLQRLMKEFFKKLGIGKRPRNVGVESNEIHEDCLGAETSDRVVRKVGSERMDSKTVWG